jgi:iron complex outermembrane receptor protein
MGDFAAAAGGALAQSLEELRDLSIDDLANIEITSVSKRPEPLSRAPASVYVITNDDIRRSGARTLPEALRLAPNLEVAQINAHDYAISARGFNSFQAAIKLLVLIDGRSIYTPLHAGVFWDAPNLVLEDVDRIEVISGPGGTLWGANAFNGVINVITKSSRDTKGGLARGTYGTVDSDLALRYGGSAGDLGSWRVYGLEFWRGHTDLANDTSAADQWRGRQGGFRTDWRGGADVLTVQGDIYNDTQEADVRLNGGNVVGRWTRKFDNGSGIEVQTYFDKADRTAPGASERLNTYDVQGQHTLSPWPAHTIVWGGGFRVNHDDFRVTPGSLFVLSPESDTGYIANLFVQDQIDLMANLTLTLGTKFEYNNFTGIETMPNVRLAWGVSDTALIWGAVSRAVRTPSRLDRGLFSTNPTLINVPRADDFRSEKLTAYEIGYRDRPIERLSLSATVYYHDYDDLRVLEALPPGVPPALLGSFVISNKMHGFTAGIESWADYQLFSWWRLSAGLNLFRERLSLEPGASSNALTQHQGNNPQYQASLRSRMNLTDTIELDAGLRAIDRLRNPTIPEYVEADIRIGWHATDRLELELVGFNLFDPHHAESFGNAPLTEIRRGVFAGARVRF